MLAGVKIACHSSLRPYFPAFHHLNLSLMDEI